MIVINSDFLTDGIIVGTVVGDIQSTVAVNEGQVTVAIQTAYMSCAKGDEIARAIPLNQQAAFYRDLKTLVTRAIVLLTAGIVYACMPTVIFWGKISAACAISVGAGLVAISIMSLYEYFRFGTGEGQSFEDWFKGLIEVPKADFALTTAITAVAQAMGAGPVVTGIIICVFALYNIVDLARTMLKTYNFNA